MEMPASVEQLFELFELDCRRPALLRAVTVTVTVTGEQEQEQEDMGSSIALQFPRRTLSEVSERFVDVGENLPNIVSERQA